MGLPSNLPKELCSIRDAAVAHATESAPSPEQLKLLESWLEINGEPNQESMALNFQALAHGFDDIEARDFNDLLKEDLLTDAHRIAYARNEIEKEVQDGLGAALLLTYLLKRDDGVSAIIGCQFVSQHVPISWCGVFATNDAFYEYLRKSGLLVGSDIDHLDDRKILDAWPRRQRSRMNSHR